MIPLLEQFQLVTPASLREALEDLAQHPAARPFAGGTDLMVLLEAGHLPPGRYVSLSNCRELRGIEETPPPGLRRSGTPDGVSIGALTTYTDIRNSAVLVRDYPLLPLAAAETGGVATQNRGTIGGNIANASPAADTPPALLVYDAELELRSASGMRRVPYLGFHQGYKKMDLRPGELIARIHLPVVDSSGAPDPRPRVAANGGAPGAHACALGCNGAVTPGAQAVSRDRLFFGRALGGAVRGQDPPSRVAAGWRDYYRKVGTRRAQAISKVCFAGSVLIDAGGVVKDVRIALGSVAPTVMRATRTEDALRGRRLDEAAIAHARQTLASEIAPIDDIRSTAGYRTRVAVNLLREFLQGSSR